VTASLSAGLRMQRAALVRALDGLLRNDPEAYALRAEIAVLNDNIRSVSRVEAGQSSMSEDLRDARQMVETWQANETERRAALTMRERKRDQLERQVNDLEAKIATSVSALELERSESNQRVSVMLAPQLKSARLPSPGILAVAGAVIVGATAWLGGALLIEAANPRLRSAEDLVSKLNIAAFGVIPDLGEGKPKNRQRRPERGPQVSEPLMFVPGSRA
ncbi:MAG: hypothetical protein ABI459_11910, partial [Deltaproteobacteria bacterium]